MIEGVSNSLLWISYEDTFLRFGFELIRLKLFHISINPKLSETTTLVSCQTTVHKAWSQRILTVPYFNVNVVVSNA